MNRRDYQRKFYLENRERLLQRAREKYKKKAPRSLITKKIEGDREARRRAVREMLESR